MAKEPTGPHRTHTRPRTSQARVPREPEDTITSEPRDATSSEQETPMPPEGERMETQAGRNMFKGLTESATSVVARAASILEEEIAAGIVAAKRVESRFIDVNAIRAGKSDEVLLRFRRDAHEVVDILVDLVVVATNAVGGLTRSVVRITGETPGGAAEGAPTSSRASMPTVSPAGATRPGTTVELIMSLENDGDTPTEEFTFHATDLVNLSGDRILADQISCSPRSLVIPPHDRAQLAISITVPDDAATGVYTGLLQAAKLGRLRAMLLVPVE